MVADRWTGTMNLTEPQAGSDLAALRSRAVPEGDHYRVSGNKIFITWGEHDMAENIVHLVLARLPDAPPGVKGISLFLDRKSTRLNSSHLVISYAVFCLKKKTIPSALPSFQKLFQVSATALSIP